VGSRISLLARRRIFPNQLATTFSLSAAPFTQSDLRRVHAQVSALWPNQ
jgi:hypothetical protein